MLYLLNQNHRGTIKEPLLKVKEAKQINIESRFIF